jgi:glycosyltransferase involved in cell wall biosynthesis
MVHEKNIGFLLRVVAEVKRSEPQVLFILAGEGPAEEWLRREGEALGLFSEAVLKLLADEGLQQRLGDEGREYAASWSATAMAMRLEDVYMECVESTMLFGRMLSSEE